MMKVLISVGILMLAFACASAREYTVGDDLGWTGPPNITVGYYDSWAANKTFKSTDNLKFVWNGTHNVAMVSKQDYDNCTKVIPSADPGGVTWFLFPIDANGTYYFICTVDSHCEGGQKLAVNVTPGFLDNACPSSMITNFGLVISAMISLVALFIFA